jgi:hypothetical protein
VAAKLAGGERGDSGRESEELREEKSVWQISGETTDLGKIGFLFFF